MPWAAHPGCWRSIPWWRVLPPLVSAPSLVGASFSLSTADSHPGNVPCSIPTLPSPRSLRFVCDFLYKSSALALNFSILLYILYNREPLGIFSHVLRLRGELLLERVSNRIFFPTP